MLKGTAGVVSVATPDVDYATPGSVGSTGVQLGASITSLSGFTTAMSGVLQSLITGAANDVNSINGATGDLTLTSAPANANYVKVTTSGNTIMISGDTTPLLSGVTFAGGGTVSGDANVVYVVNRLAVNGASSPSNRQLTVNGAVGPTIGLQLAGVPSWALGSDAQNNLLFAREGVGGVINANSSALSNSLSISPNSNTLLGFTGDLLNGKLQLNTHTTSGGGLGLGPDNSIWRTAANQVTYNGTLTLTGLVLAGNAAISGNADNIYLVPTGGIGNVIIGGANTLTANGATRLSAAGTNSLNIPPGILELGQITVMQRNAGNGNVTLSTNAGDVLLSPPAGGAVVINRNVAGGSGLFFSDTGNYTPSGAASVAQLLAESGWWANSATSNLVYTTGQQNVAGVKSFTTSINVGGFTGNTTAGTVAQALRVGYSNSTSSTAPTAASGLAYYAAFGGREFGLNSYRLLGFGFHADADSFYPAYMGYQETSVAGETFGDLVFGTRSSTSDVVPTERMRITSAGLVGIGTGTPTDRLTVNYSSAGINNSLGLIYGTTTNDGAGVNFRIDDNATPTVVGSLINTRTAAGSYATIFRNWDGSSNAEIMRVQSTNGAGSNKLGIGTSVPQQLLHVSGGNARVDGSGTFAGDLRVTGLFRCDNGIGMGAEPDAGNRLNVRNDANGARSILMSNQAATASASANVASSSNGGSTVMKTTAVQFTPAGLILANAGSVLTDVGIAGGLTLGALGVAPLIFATSNGEVARFTSTSGFGIGTTAPQQLVHISGGNLRVDGSGLFTDTTQATNAGVGAVAISGGLWVGKKVYAADNVAVVGNKRFIVANDNGTSRGFQFTSSSEGTEYGSLNYDGTSIVLMSNAKPLVLSTNNGTTQTLSLGTNQAATFASGIVLGTSNVTGGGIAFGSDTNLSRSAPGTLQQTATAGNAVFYLLQQGNGPAGIRMDANLGSNKTYVDFRPAGSANAEVQYAGVAAISIGSNLTTTLASGLILGSSNVTGGGIAFGSDTYLSRATVNDLAITRPGFGTLYLYSNNAGSQGIFSGPQGAGAAFYTNSTSQAFIQTSNALAVTIDTNQNASFTAKVSAVGVISGRSYVASVSGVAIPVAAGATGTYNIDFTNSAALQTITITGATLFSGVNYVAGGAVTMRVNVSGANAAAVRFPALWNNGWVTAIPTGIATGRFAIMTINTFTANDTGCMVAWAVAP